MAIDADGQLYRADYAAKCIALASCIGRGQSWRAAQRFAFLLRVAAGLSEDECLACWDALVARPGHEARSCRDARARQDLRREFRCELRYAQEGIDEGRLHPGLLSRPDLRALVDELRAEAGLSAMRRSTTAVARRDRTWAETIAARREAALRGVATRRARAAGEVPTAAEVVDEEIHAVEVEVARWETSPLAALMLPDLLARLSILAGRKILTGRCRR